MNVQEATPLAERREGTHYRTGKAPSTDERCVKIVESTRMPDRFLA
jgi:hypothetical protein